MKKSRLKKVLGGVLAGMLLAVFCMASVFAADVKTSDSYSGEGGAAEVGAGEAFTGLIASSETSNLDAAEIGLMVEAKSSLVKSFSADLFNSENLVMEDISAELAQKATALQRKISRSQVEGVAFSTAETSGSGRSFFGLAFNVVMGVVAVLGAGCVTVAIILRARLSKE